MLKSASQQKNKTHRNSRLHNNRNNSSSRRLASMGRTSANIINQLYSPIDAINRFINLALHSLEEDSQSRQFLIESKKGVRKTSLLLKRLNHYVKRIEEGANRLDMEVSNE